MARPGRFELQTSCSGGKCPNPKHLVRLVLYYVTYDGFVLYLAAFVPKLFPRVSTAVENHGWKKRRLEQGADGIGQCRHCAELATVV